MKIHLAVPDLLHVERHGDKWTGMAKLTSIFLQILVANVPKNGWIYKHYRKYVKI
jgi:hypothetical protein